jgi:hypothetical protein
MFHRTDEDGIPEGFTIQVPGGATEEEILKIEEGGVPCVRHYFPLSKQGSHERARSEAIKVG